eukprot:gnl/TRDRNA2_/TRDRNA2_195119_c0_seq1.p1 gnl/TRDRNA2_/TRDRNA2_195119_c0~~gnl/TRDRNA2_/TRDRNA2_195119_c0_seq1.p1  ORF type:complete len:290 (-),score=49.13 gnl/TRDRNA2_/TRDRNA2_195119_c0_seq1:85-891(-)
MRDLRMVRAEYKQRLLRRLRDPAVRADSRWSGCVRRSSSIPAMTCAPTLSRPMSPLAHSRSSQAASSSSSKEPATVSPDAKARPSRRVPITGSSTRSRWKHVNGLWHQERAAGSSRACQEEKTSRQDHADSALHGADMHAAPSGGASEAFEVSTIEFVAEPSAYAVGDAADMDSSTCVIMPGGAPAVVSTPTPSRRHTAAAVSPAVAARQSAALALRGVLGLTTGDADRTESVSRTSLEQQLREARGRERMLNIENARLRRVAAAAAA